MYLPSLDLSPKHTSKKHINNYVCLCIMTIILLWTVSLPQKLHYLQDFSAYISRLTPHKRFLPMNRKSIETLWSKKLMYLYLSYYSQILKYTVSAFGATNSGPKSNVLPYSQERYSHRRETETEIKKILQIIVLGDHSWGDCGRKV